MAEPIYMISAAGEPDYEALDWDDVLRYLRGLCCYSRIAIDIWEKREESDNEPASG